jgi:hypothetical protein
MGDPFRQTEFRNGDQSGRIYVRPLFLSTMRSRGFWNPGMFQETHPILGTRDSQRPIDFAPAARLQAAFADTADPPNYVGFRRDAVVLHMQFQFEYEMGTIRLRFLVTDPDALFNEYRQRGVECTPNGVHDTSWGTREFALYDLDRNALTFYRDLTSAENGWQCS